MAPLNLHFAWCWILAGLVSGAVIGMFFRDEAWLGGYGSWRRRMLRLGHVAFVGTGLLNLAFALSVDSMLPQASATLPGALFLAGAVTMPLVCFLSAWRDGFRHFFFVPVLCLVAAVARLVLGGFSP